MMLTQKLHFFLDRTVRNGFFIISDLPFSHLGMGTDGSVLETSGDSLVKANEDLVQDRQCFNFNDFFWTKLAKVFEPLTFFNALFGVFVLGESCVTKSNVSVWKLKASVVTCPKKTCVENSKKTVLVTTSFEQPHVFLRPPPPIEKKPTNRPGVEWSDCRWIRRTLWAQLFWWVVMWLADRKTWRYRAPKINGCKWGCI